MNLYSGPAQRHRPGIAPAPAGSGDQDAQAAVTALYRDHAVALIKLAHVMLASRTTAEDVVQDAFYGLYRHWNRLADKDKAVGYLRTSVLNGCRTALRRKISSPEIIATREPMPATSAEAAVLWAAERGEVARALRRLPNRQREVLVLTYYLDLTGEQISAETGIRATSIRSARHRGLAALGRVLKESS
jgi:RNA polymerase sigma-70 factor (sigma-E family)